MRSPLRVHVLQHVSFEDEGSIGTWLRSVDSAVSTTRLFDRPELPPPEEIDFLIAMGGPMSANDEARLAWLASEKAFIREVIARDKAVLGVCLGAQLIAAAMGARIRRQTHLEIGWFPVFGLQAPPGCFAFPAQFLAFHWHGETFDLPPGAVHLARSEGCAHQAFQLGRRVLGLQFHLETTFEGVQALVAHGRHELMQGPFVQPETEILGASHAWYRGAHAILVEVLDYLSQGLVGSV